MTSGFRLSASQKFLWATIY